MADIDEPILERKSTKTRWLVITLLLIIVLLVGGAAAYWYFFMRQPGEGPDATEGQTTSEISESKSAEVVTLPTFLVNLADPLGRRYVKMTLDVELRDPKAAEELQKNQAKVRDAVILLLSSKSYADLASLENKIILKQEIVDRLNQALSGSKVLRVYFTELVVQ